MTGVAAKKDSGPASAAPPREPSKAAANLRRPIGRHLFTLVQVGLAALLFMAITQLNQVIVTRGLALLGLRTDAPTIVRIIDSCGNRIETAPARSRAALDWDSARLCKESLDRGVDIVATAP